jgi:hypothetical protein
VGVLTAGARCRRWGTYQDRSGITLKEPNAPDLTFSPPEVAKASGSPVWPDCDPTHVTTRMDAACSAPFTSAPRPRSSCKAAWEAKDIGALIGLLDPDATFAADGGGLVSAALRPIEGGEQIARYVVDLAGRASGNVTILEHTVNGQPGLVAQRDGGTVTVFAFAVTSDRIALIWAVRNPDKLRPWTG